MNARERATVRDFHNLYYDGPQGEGRIYDRTRWMGVPCEKCPLDLWIYQEIIVETRPDLIVETGTRFGGSALDYQLAEEEDDRGYTRIVLRIGPRVDIADEAAVKATVLDALATASISADLAGRLWNQAGAFVVRREQPQVGGGGKLMPLHLG